MSDGVYDFLIRSQKDTQSVAQELHYINHIQESIIKKDEELRYNRRDNAGARVETDLTLTRESAM